mgnify:CR=1 FL=1
MATIESISTLSQIGATQPLPLGTKPGRSDLHANPSTREATANVAISPPSKLQSERELSLALGQRVRETDATLTRAMTLVDGMREQLGKITKQFPPFAQDDDERLRFLNSFSSLRAQVEALTFPRDPQATGEWNQIEFPPERMNWDIPRLDAHASDAVVRSAELALEQTGAKLLAQRQSLYQSVIGVVGDTTTEAARDMAMSLRNQLSG